jgi:hypothetical protein
VDEIFFGGEVRLHHLEEFCQPRRMRRPGRAGDEIAVYWRLRRCWKGRESGDVLLLQS